MHEALMAEFEKLATKPSKINVPAIEEPRALWIQLNDGEFTISSKCVRTSDGMAAVGTA